MIKDREIRRSIKNFKKLFKEVDDKERLKRLKKVEKYIENIETKNARLTDMKEISFLK